MASFAWITLFDLALAQQQVLVEVLDLKESPDPLAKTVSTLKKGDPIKILQTKDNWRLVEFQFQDQFTIRGWVPTESIGGHLSDHHLALDQNPYQKGEMPLPEPPPNDSSTDRFPNLQSSGRLPVQPPTTTDFPSLSSGASKIPEFKAPKRSGPPRAEGPWLIEAQAGLALWAEKVKTMESAAYTDPYLDYDMMGLLVRLSAAYRERRWAPWTLETRLSYSWTNFSKDLESTDRVRLQSQGILAQGHEIELTTLGGYQISRLKQWPRFQWSLEPRLGFSLHYFLWNTNQLSTLSTIDPQPVLFPFQRFSLPLVVELAFRWLPYLDFTPTVGAEFFSSHREGSRQAKDPVEDSFQSGESAGGSFTIPWGFKARFHLSSFEWGRGQIVADYHSYAYERKFSGQGQRAGLAQQNTTSMISLSRIGLGYALDF